MNQAFGLKPGVLDVRDMPGGLFLTDALEA
jgi:hypothetical protein